jgi:nucleotide-binding universal stress UspA family protein
VYERVLVGTDGSGTASRAVEAAGLVASAHGAELVIAHAFSPRPTPGQKIAWLEAPDELRWRLSVGVIAEATVLTAIERALAVAGDRVRVDGRCEPGHPVPVLLGLIDELDPDVLVIGNRDMPRRIRAHRSVARALSRRATCDVVVVDTIGRRQRRRDASHRPALGCV